MLSAKEILKNRRKGLDKVMLEGMPIFDTKRKENRYNSHGQP